MPCNRPRMVDTFPLVVLVQGSGPLDMDVTIGPNKFFKDLALMLAANGIASVRFYKRTAAYSNELRMAIETMSPFFNLRGPGIPCTTSSFMLTHNVAGYPS